MLSEELRILNIYVWILNLFRSLGESTVSLISDKKDITSDNIVVIL